MPARLIFLDLPALLVPYVPNFQYFLYDLTTVDDTEIKGDLILQAGLLSLKYARDENLKDKLKKIFELIDQLGDPQKVQEYLGTVEAGRHARGSLPLEHKPNQPKRD